MPYRFDAALPEVGAPDGPRQLVRLGRVFAAVFLADLMRYIFLFLACLGEFFIADCVAEQLLGFADGDVLPGRRRLWHPQFPKLLFALST